ncbi:MAG: AAA family ATPase, partial [Planctomycetales bacterium]|nr:AAA family ATPase [Planctomycetales bacterium]
VAKGVSGAEVARFVEHQLDASGRVTPVGKLKGQRQFSTPDILAEEQSIVATANALASGKSHQLTTAGITARLSIGSMGAVRDWFRLRNGDGSEQHNALRYLVCDSGQVCILDGQKSERLPVLTKATSFWEASGYTVLGTSPSARATQSFEKQTGAPSITLGSLLWRAEQDASLTAGAKHTVKQIVREAAGRYIGLYPWQRKKLLDAKTIVLVDKAEQLSTQDLGSLLTHVKRAGAKLVLSGDSQLIHSIERGAPFGRLCSDLRKAQLTRGSKPVEQIRSGKSEELLRDLANAGRLQIAKTRAEAMERLVADWHSNGGSRNPAANLIVANSKAEAKRLNDLASRKVRSELGNHGDSIILPSGEKVCEGDRILCERGNKRYAISAGELGTLLSVSRRLNAIRVRLDSGHTATIPLDSYKHVTRGFAVTTWQSSECENSYVLLGGGFENKQAALVKASQSQIIYGYADQASAGEKLERLQKQLIADRRKRLATDIHRDNGQEREVQP